VTAPLVPVVLEEEGAAGVAPPAAGEPLLPGEAGAPGELAAPPLPVPVPPSMVKGPAKAILGEVPNSKASKKITKHE
jgi:hypothetical protein